VLLKTGFEALSGRSRTHEAAAWLRLLFEQVVIGDAAKYQTDHLLWSPSELPSRPFVTGKGSVDCTDLEHWFRTFGAVRNSIIHGNVVNANQAYAEAGSAYNGPYFHTAGRLLREALKVELTRLGHERLFWEPTTRAACELIERGGEPAT
jgi:hypothetical protein